MRLVGQWSLKNRTSEVLRRQVMRRHQHVRHGDLLLRRDHEAVRLRVGQAEPVSARGVRFAYAESCSAGPDGVASDSLQTVSSQSLEVSSKRPGACTHQRRQVLNVLAELPRKVQRPRNQRQVVRHIPPVAETHKNLHLQTRYGTFC